jgi:hypothetical protein
MTSNSSSPRSNETRQSPQPENHKSVEDEQVTPVPAHVNVVKDGLLDFNHFLGLEAVLQVLGTEESDDGDEAIPVYAFKAGAPDAKSSQQARDREFLENAQQLTRDAKKLQNGLPEDSEWRGLFRTVINHRMSEAHSPL